MKRVLWEKLVEKRKYMDRMERYFEDWRKKGTGKKGIQKY